MKTWKLVSGIISIVLCGFVLFQSFAAGVYNALMRNGQVSGSAGVVVAIMLLSGGIVSIVTRKGSNGGNTALLILYGIAIILGYSFAGDYKDLFIWSTWCLICFFFAVASMVKGNPEDNDAVWGIKISKFLPVLYLSHFLVVLVTTVSVLNLIFK